MTVTRNGSTSRAGWSARALRAILTITMAAAVTLLAGCGDDESPTDPGTEPTIGAPVQLAFVTQPADAVAGTAISPSVQVAIQDAEGNVVTDVSGSVSVDLGQNSSGAALLGTTTVTAVDGIATFDDLSIETAGTGYTLTATSGSLNSLASVAFEVAPASPDGIAFVAVPAEIEANAIVDEPVVVAIQDEFGNTVMDATGEVTLSLADHPRGGQLVGTSTVQAANGLATFSDITIDRSGEDYELIATLSDPAFTGQAAVDVTFTWAVVSAGEGHTCGLQVTGIAYCWGTNGSGQLGDGNAGTDSYTPVAVTGGLTFAWITAGIAHTCGVTVDGEAYCWGDNGDGQLGDGNAGTDSDTPVAVVGGVTFVAVSAGGASSHTCGVATDGGAYCWGNNFSGQLGDGNMGTNSATPVAVVGGLAFAEISANGSHTCGITVDGEAYCWGYNGYGQLGDGNMGTNSDTPVAVTGGLTFADIDAGALHSCGITTGGQAYCWGNNFIGQLGGGNMGTDSDTPVAVAGGLAFAKISGGTWVTCGITVDGAAYCWGDNGDGELGDGNTGTSSDTPVAVVGGLAFAGISVGSHYACGVTVDGEAYCWGNNAAGKLGNGNTGTNSATPVRVVDP